jgi:hypothetical protein
MATIITIKMEEDLKSEVRLELGGLFADALYEFKGNRTPIAEYFKKRYGDGKTYFNEAERAKKMAQIDRRVTLASMLHNPVLRLEARSGLGEGHSDPEKEAYWHRKYEEAKTDFEAHVKTHGCDKAQCDVKECLELFHTSSMLIFEAFKEKAKTEQGRDD